jgi:hypothetical protein
MSCMDITGSGPTSQLPRPVGVPQTALYKSVQLLKHISDVTGEEYADQLSARRDKNPDALQKKDRSTSASVFAIGV